VITKRQRRAIGPRARYGRDDGPLTAGQVKAIRRLQPPERLKTRGTLGKEILLGLEEAKAWRRGELKLRARTYKKGAA